MAAENVTSEEVIKAARKAGRELTDDQSLGDGFDQEEKQAEVLAEYLNLLVKWNKSMNLVGPSGWREVFSSLVIDSLHLADFLNSLSLPEEPVTLDLGAGAGLPGIPLRCVWQKGSYHLVESRQKRSIFMRTALRSMKLPRTVVFQGRAENISEEDLPADLILSKAFMPWKELLPFVSGMLAENGRVIILSNDQAPENSEIESFGFSLEAVRDYKAGEKTHYFWALKAAQV